MTRSSDESGIIRTAKDRDHPYKLVNREFAEDERLSWEARGVLAYLLVKPDDWQVRVRDLQHKAPHCGRDKLRGILRELERCGYLVRERIRHPNGRVDWVSTIYETPRDQPITIDGLSVYGLKVIRKPSEPSPEKPATADQATVHQATVFQGIYMNSKETNKEGGDEGGGAARRSPTTPQIKDPNQQHPACLVYLELTSYRPHKVGAAWIAAQVTDLKLWRQVVEEWLTSGGKLTNIKGMLDWYHNGGPTYAQRTPSRRNGRVEPRVERPLSRKANLDRDL